MDSLHRPQIITYYTEVWPKQTLLKQSPLGTIFSGPDKVIQFFSSSHYNEDRAASFDIPGVYIQT